MPTDARSQETESLGDPGSASTWGAGISPRLEARLPDLAAAPADYLRGERLGARRRYQILEWVGAGATASVYRARDCELGRHVALKILARRGQPAVDAFALARFRHENIVTIYDHGDLGGHRVLVLEWVEGETLQARIARGGLGAAEAVAIVIQVVRALVHAHANGVLHRDLKPANILLSDQGQVKVTDFGVALVTLTESRSESGFGKRPDEVRDLLGTMPGVAGTPVYMAPEQWRGAADARSDLFACGEILYEILTGKPPFPLGPDRSAAARLAACSPEGLVIPAGFERVLEKTLAPDPAARFQSAEELLVALDALAGARRPAEAAGELPFRYLEAFSEDDAPWFFGRDAETTALQLVLARRPLVAVVGPSGAGKSSLVQAGLLRRLRLDLVPWRVLTMQPGPAPLETLCARIGAAPAPRVEAAAVRAAPGIVGQALRELAASSGGRVLLFVDQLEELYAYPIAAADRAAFSAALLAAGDDAAGPVRVILTMREDFLPRLAESPELERLVAQNRVYVRPPSRDAMLDALRGPARALSYRFDAALDEEIVAALEGEPTPLPLLELTASRVWEKRDEARRLLPRAALADLGGVAGIMASHAEEVLAELGSAPAVEIARQIFCELVTAERTKQHRGRDELLATFADRELAGSVLEHLLRRRLLISRKGAESLGIEVPSEALLQRWQRLQLWLDEGLAARMLRERIEQAAGHWGERGRPRELLWTGRGLAEAVSWPAARRAALAPVARAFLAACIARQRRRRRWLWALAATVGLLLGGIAVASSAAMRIYAAQRDQAREFARLLLFDLYDGIEPLPGSTPVMNQLVSAALGYYRSTVDPDDGDAAQRRNLGVAFEKLGGVALRLGRTEDARDMQERASRVFTQLVRERPRAPESTFDLARSLAKLGATAIEQGRAEDAEGRLDASLELLRGLAAERPGDVRAQSELAVSHRVLGDFLGGRGRLDEADRHLQQALAVRETLAMREPGRADWQLELALAHQKVGTVARTQRHFDEAFLHYERARLLRERLVALDPNNMLWLADLGKSYAVLAELARQRERLDESRGYALQMLAVETRMAIADSTQPDHQRGVALAHARLGVVANLQHRLADAKFHWELELAAIRSVADADPHNTSWQRDLARSYSRLGDLALAQKHLDAAEARQAQALAIRERLAAADPGDMTGQRELTLSLERQGQLAQARGRLDAARIHGLRELRIREVLTLRHPGNVDLERDRATTHTTLGNLARTQGQLEDAAGHLEAAAAIAVHLADAQPDDPRARDDLAESREDLALVGDGFLDRAEAALARRQPGLARRSLDCAQAILDRGAPVAPRRAERARAIARRLSPAE